MKKIVLYTFTLAAIFLFIGSGCVFAQSDTVRISKIELAKKKKHNFRNLSRDSTILVYIDTLIMKDRSSLQFFGNKDVELHVNHAEIGKRAFIDLRANENNAANMDAFISFNKLGSLFILANGLDAHNGTKTFPNGDGGIVNLHYNDKGVKPQSSNKKENNYLEINIEPGGQRVNPNAEISQIYSQIARAPRGLRGLPQGQVYSGSEGKKGKKSVQAIQEN